MDKETLERELREVEQRMKQVDKGSRAYRAGLIIRNSILNELTKIEETEK